MRTSERSYPLLALLLLVLASGCDRTVYEVLLQPHDNLLKRTLECRRVDRDGPHGEVMKPMPQEELDRLTAIYDVPSGPTEARRFTFTREFAGTTPADFGGAGYYRCWTSSLGTLGVYVERFRGRDDQAAVLEKRQKAAARLIELLGGWLQSRLGQTPGWSELQACLKGPLRRDLDTLALTAWAGQYVQDTGAAEAAGSPEAGSAARALLFLGEHGYLLPQELPAWVRAFRDLEGGDGSLAALAPLISNAVARRAGLKADAEVVVALRAELSQKTLQDGLNGWLQTSPEWQAKLADWDARHAQEPGAAAPAPVEILGDLALEAAGFGPDAGGSGDELHLRLALPVRPFHANGAWDPAAQQVAWQATLPGAGRTPYLAYASWAVADEAAQRQHFGRVLLRDQALAEYVLWVQGLEQEDAAEWEAFVALLRPETAPAARLAEFRFKSEASAAPASAASRAEPARKLLLEALQAKATTP